MNLKEHIRGIPNFPKPGIFFYDISTLLAHPEAWSACIEKLAHIIAPQKPDLLVGIESRGFLFSTLLAYRIGVGSVMIRKSGKLPGVLIKKNYALEYGETTLELQKESQLIGKSIILLDDLLATGGTIGAAKSLLEQCGAVVVACAVVVELRALKGRENVGLPVISLQSYD